VKSWRLTFAAVGVGPPEELRIRKLLKAAARAFGLKCLDIRVVDGDDERLVKKRVENGQDNGIDSK
jgi:citrate lyase beta subunit